MQGLQSLKLPGWSIAWKDTRRGRGGSELLLCPAPAINLPLKTVKYIRTCHCTSNSFVESLLSNQTVSSNVAQLGMPLLIQPFERRGFRRTMGRTLWSTSGMSWFPFVAKF
jgi:hypothetical protein